MAGYVMLVGSFVIAMAIEQDGGIGAAMMVAFLGLRILYQVGAATRDDR